jgi:hypothetical protein
MTYERQRSLKNVCAEGKVVRVVCGDINLVQATPIGAKSCPIVTAKLMEMKGVLASQIGHLFRTLRCRRNAVWASVGPYNYCGRCSAPGDLVRPIPPWWTILICFPRYMI